MSPASTPSQVASSPIPVTIRVRVNQKDAILRELRRRILQSFEENGIPLGTDPANMLIMKHDPTAPPAQQPLVSA